MKIALITDWYSENMGYSENLLPKAFAALGHEVHVISTNAQVYYDSPNYVQTYESRLGPRLVECGSKSIDGYLLHRLPLIKWKLHRLIQIKGLHEKLVEIRPHIVQTLDVACLSTIQAALISKSLGFKLFGESHTHESVFLPTDKGKFINDVKWFFLAKTMGRFISSHLCKCYPISDDCADIVIKYFGINKKKIKVCSLGVDTDYFKPSNGNWTESQREAFRASLGINPHEIVCIYTGRLTEDKNPLCLAKAIDDLSSKGRQFRGLFIGNGTVEQIDAIKACRGCIVHPFVSVTELPKFYWSSDVGVWPRQESTSQLDAAACGLSLILSNRITVRERIDGNGLLYNEDDDGDLAAKLMLFEDPLVRRQMGIAGSEKVLNNYSWKKIATDRIADYESALRYEK